MLLKFTNEGYKYTDIDGSVFYEETNEHKGLFKFLAADLSKLPDQLESYFSKIVDISTLKLKNYKPTYDDLEEISDFLYDIHPYFEFVSCEVLDQAIGDYFNCLLINSSYHKDDYSFSPIYDKEWYFDSFRALFPNMTFTKDGLTESYYQQYSNVVKQEDYLPPLPPKGFFHLINLQEWLRSIVFWILDASAPKLNKLTIPQRAWVYGNVHSTVSDQPHMVVTKQISFKDPHSTGYASGYRRLEYIGGIDHHFTLFGDLQNYYKNQNNAPLEALDYLDRLIELAQRGYTEEIYEEYVVNSLDEVLFLEIYHMFLNQTAIKKCRHCGMYFVVNNLNVEYCDRVIDDEEKTCSEIGPKRSFQKKLEK
ncbi:MAG: DUF6076 domain-containing protein, partial [Bacteroides sp.]|nr:DUF6076 domain-containing protein [Bacteroides sp.]